MVVHADRMRENLDLTHGALFSQRVLLALVARRPCSATTPTASSRRRPSAPGTRGTPLRELLEARARARASISTTIFDLAHYTRHAGEIVGRLDALT